MAKNFGNSLCLRVRKSVLQRKHYPDIAHLREMFCEKTNVTDAPVVPIAMETGEQLVMYDTPPDSACDKLVAKETGEKLSSGKDGTCSKATQKDVERSEKKFNSPAAKAKDLCFFVKHTRSNMVMDVCAGEAVPGN